MMIGSFSFFFQFAFFWVLQVSRLNICHFYNEAKAHKYCMCTNDQFPKLF